MYRGQLKMEHTYQLVHQDPDVYYKIGEYGGLGPKTNAQRAANLDRPAVRLRAKMIIQAYLPYTIWWYSDILSLPDSKPVLWWFMSLDAFYLSSTREALINAQTAFNNYRWKKPDVMLSFVRTFRKLNKELERHNDGNKNSPGFFWDTLEISIISVHPSNPACGFYTDGN